MNIESTQLFLEKGIGEREEEFEYMIWFLCCFKIQWLWFLNFEFKIGRFGVLLINFLITITMDPVAFKHRIPCYNRIMGLNKIKSQFSLLTMFEVLMVSSTWVCPSTFKVFFKQKQFTCACKSGWLIMWIGLLVNIHWYSYILLVLNLH